MSNENNEKIIGAYLKSKDGSYHSNLKSVGFNVSGYYKYDNDKVALLGSANCREVVFGQFVQFKAATDVGNLRIKDLITSYDPKYKDLVRRIVNELPIFTVDFELMDSLVQKVMKSTEGERLIKGMNYVLDMLLPFCKCILGREDYQILKKVFVRKFPKDMEELASKVSFIGVYGDVPTSTEERFSISSDSAYRCTPSSTSIVLKCGNYNGITFLRTEDIRRGTQRLTLDEYKTSKSLGKYRFNSSIRAFELDFSRIPNKVSFASGYMLQGIVRNVLIFLTYGLLPMIKSSESYLGLTEEVNKIELPNSFGRRKLLYSIVKPINSIKLSGHFSLHTTAYNLEEFKKLLETGNVFKGLFKRNVGFPANSPSELESLRTFSSRKKFKSLVEVTKVGSKRSLSRSGRPRPQAENNNGPF